MFSMWIEVKLAALRRFSLSVLKISTENRN